MKFSVTTTAALAAALALPSVAHADSDADPTIIVTGKAAADAARQQAADTPGGTDVVTYEDYADKTAVSLRDALAFSPGIYTQPRFGQEVRISIRGSGLSRGFHMRGLTLLQDGVPINLADDNGDFQELEPIFFDHLEVYRGANALRFGSGTLGGAINGVTPRGDTAPGLYARLDAGSFNLVRGLVSGGFGNEQVNAWGAISADRHDGDRQHADRHSLRFNGNVGIGISDAVSTRFYVSSNTIRQQLPGALTIADALSTPEKGNFAGDQARDIDSLRLQNRTTVDLGDVSLSLGGFYNHKQLYHPIFMVIDQKSEDRGVFARSEFNAGIVSLTLGGESRWGTTRARQFVNIAGKRGAETFRAQQRARTSTVYGELRVTPVPELSLIVGAIYADGFREQVRTVPSRVIGRASFDAVSPKFGVLWRAADGVEVYANYSRSAEFPTFVELAQQAAFVPVAEQRAWTAEIGSRGRLGPVQWDISAYRADLTGEMLQYTPDANVGIPAATFNAGRTRHQGIEAGLTWTPSDWLRLRQTWQYSDFRFRGDVQFGNNRLPVIPRHALRSEVRIGSDAMHIAPTLEWLPQGAFADYRNTVRTAGYALIGLTAGATVRPGLDVFADVRNLTGKKALGDVSAVIAATAASAIYYPVERRAVYAGIRSRF
ncbi:iron complex outermembrane receptor protein [Novosphingobium hassiacum]|uniref:Iron complex outermembrane receptor protein n=1 Tax=Novosphingobium hassiacum TaxID=173676 RepID=A0A7W6A005_9SPHN|nr:TonB-dependent receptor [Novosphingobium hassiacum]MBB3862228.1 iron complex outermembrane receptor protein [Novosphingobium hassiacum]